MDHQRFSLMTFSMAWDVRKKTITIADMFRLAADYGIPSVDVMRVGGKELPQYLAAAKQSGVSVYCYIGSVSFFQKDERILEALKKEMETSQKLGAKLFMIVASFFDERKAKKLGREKTREIMANGFRLAVDMAKEMGLTVCFETTPKDALCLSGTEDCRWMLEQVPGLGLVFDTANMLPHGDDPMESYEVLRSHVIHVHLKDIALREPKFTLYPHDCAADGKFMSATVFGEGVIPVRKLHQRMLRDGYPGRFAIEYVRDPQRALTPAQHKDRLNRFLKYLEDV